MSPSPSKRPSSVAADSLRAWLRAFAPAPIAIDARERWRAALGALIGIAFTAFLGHWLADVFVVSAWMLAPAGATAVLVFATPASPLAQPWPVVAGNTLSAVIGAACATWIPDTTVAGAVAVALAISAMFALRCLHPPGGAMALLSVLAHASLGSVVVPVALIDSVLLVSAGIAYNSLTGRRYPHTQLAPAPREAGQGGRFRAEDLDVALARYNQVLDVSRDDLEALLLSAELEGYKRRMAQILCRDVMSRDLACVEFGSTLQEAWMLMRARRIKALPVLDAARRVIGIVTMADFLRSAQLEHHHGFAARLRAFLLPEGRAHSEKPDVVGQIMTRGAQVVRQEQRAMELMPIFAEAGHHHIPVVDQEQRIVGIIAQSDFVRALYQAG